MKNSHGFALAVTLLFLLLLTLFGFSVLMLAGNYYASTRNLFEKENARITCNQAIHLMIDRHNLESAEPRFFQDAAIWQGIRMTPFTWNDHEITASLEKPWSTAEINRLSAVSRKGPYAAGRMAQVRQRRLEDFAIYVDDALDLRTASLFDGPVFARGGVRLGVTGTSFRNTVQGLVEPREFASFRRENLQNFLYPEVVTSPGGGFFRQEAQTRGFVIAGHHAAFWKSDRYELNLDLLQIEKQPRNRWRLRYDGVDLGIAAQPLLWFDDTVAVSQAAAAPVFLVQKPAAPLYIASAGDVRILTSLHAPEDSAFRHPLALAAEDALYVDGSAPRVLCLQALLIAFGSDRAGGEERSLLIEPGGLPVPEEQLRWFRAAVAGSAFLMEEQHRNTLLQALENNERIAWFRGGLALSKKWLEPEEPVHLHFQGGADAYPLLPSLPFVYIVEGSERWL